MLRIPAMRACTCLSLRLFPTDRVTPPIAAGNLPVRRPRDSLAAASTLPRRAR